MGAASMRQGHQAAEVEEARTRIARRRHRRRINLIALVAVAVIAAAGMVVQQLRTGGGDVAAPDTVPQAAGEDWTGIPVSSGPVRVEVYLDYLCPSCAKTEREIEPVLADLIDQGTIELVYHPVAMLDEYSSPAGYSTRAAAAAACAADGGQLRDFGTVLFAQQPPENEPGLTNDRLVSIGTGEDVGLDPQAFGDCVRGGRYTQWADRATEKAYASGIAGTPAVIVDGRQLTVDPDTVKEDLIQAVQDAEESG